MFLSIGSEIKLDFSIFQMQFSLKGNPTHVLLSDNEDFSDGIIQPGDGFDKYMAVFFSHFTFQAFPNSPSLKHKLNFSGMFYTIISILVSGASTSFKCKNLA